MRKIFFLLAFICATKGVRAQGFAYFDHGRRVNEFNGFTMQRNLIPLWFDSTVLEPYPNAGIGPIKYLSALQVLDPIYYSLWVDSGISIPPTEPYTVDTITFGGVYVKNVNRPNTIVDTLIISVSPHSYEAMIDFNSQADPNDDWVDAYVPMPGDTIFGFTIFDVDSINRASNVQGRVIWKIPLDSTMRLVTTGTLDDIDTFVVPVPGGCNIPAGHGVAITVTFKSGDVVANPYTDMFTDYHHFYFVSSEMLGAGQIMPYYYYTQNDKNMSNMMRSGDTSSYYPAVFLEGWSIIAYAPEFHSIGMYTYCPNCPVSVKNVTTSFANITAYPNPAGDEVHISFATERDEDVVVTIIDILGQVMSKKDMGAVKANTKANAMFSTKELAGGIYFYTIEANGQKSTGRFVVAR